MGGEPGPVRYDTAELRLRMAACMSAAALRDLAQALGAPLPDAAPAGELARALVRHFERTGSLQTLVDALRSARPLVEWPEGEVAPAADAPAEALSLPATASPAEVPALAVDAAATEAGAHVDVAATAAGAHVDVAATAAGAPDEAEHRAPASPRAPGSPVEEPAAAAPPASAAAWIPPGHVDPSAPRPPEKRGPDLRVVAATTMAVLIAVLVAYGLGRSTSQPAAPSAVASSTAPRSSGPAGRAAGAFERGLAAVARACELPDESGATGDVLRSAFASCGPVPPPARPRQPPLVAPSLAPEAPEPAARDLAPPRAVSPGPAGPGTACIKRCDGKHGTCRDQCGREPQESSLYAYYQACLAKCLREAQQCRLSCEL